MTTIYYLGGMFDGTCEEARGDLDEVIRKSDDAPLMLQDRDDMPAARPVETYVLVAQDGVTIFAAEQERWNTISALEEVRRRRTLSKDRVSTLSDNALKELWTSADKHHPRAFDLAVKEEMARRRVSA